MILTDHEFWVLFAQVRVQAHFAHVFGLRPSDLYGHDGPSPGSTATGGISTMLDPLAQRSEGHVEISKFGLKLSSEEGVGKLVDLDLAAVIDSEDDAKAADRVIPGALRFWRSVAAAIRSGDVAESMGGAADGQAARAVSDGIFGESKSSPPADPFVLVLGEGEAVVECPNVEIRTAKITATPRRCAYRIGVRMTGLENEEIARIVGWFGSTVRATLERKQGVLNFPTRRRVPGDLGEVVSGRHGDRAFAGLLAGRAQDEDLGSTFEIDDCGERFIVPAASVSGAIRPKAPEDLSMKDVVDRYVKSCKNRRPRLTPTWLDIVEALGERYLAQGIDANALWEVDDDVLVRAIEIASDRRDRDATQQAN